MRHCLHSANPAVIIALDIRVDIHHTHRQDHLLAHPQLVVLVRSLKETNFGLPELFNSDIAESGGLVSRYDVLSGGGSEFFGVLVIPGEDGVDVVGGSVAIVS